MIRLWLLFYVAIIAFAVGIPNVLCALIGLAGFGFLAFKGPITYTQYRRRLR
jgi:hypothetical protein